MLRKKHEIEVLAQLAVRPMGRLEIAEEACLLLKSEYTTFKDFVIFKPFSVHVVWLHMLKVVIPRVNMISASSMKLFVTKMRDCVCWDGEDLIAKILP